MAYTSMVNIRRVQQIHIALKQVILALVADYHYATCKPSLPNRHISKGQQAKNDSPNSQKSIG